MSWIGLVLCIQIEKKKIVYQIGNKKEFKDDFKVEMYPPFLTLVPNCGSTSKNPPYENVSLQGVKSIDGFSFHCNLSTKGKFLICLICQLVPLKMYSC